MDEFNLKDEIKKLEDNKRRDLNIIALYLERRKPDIQSKAQLQVVLRRHLRAARDLKPFTDEQILKACKTAEREYPKFWTLDTIIKILIK